jgi:Protein of unknown function (DUF1552)
MGDPKEIVTRGRRQFLRGAGGTLLAIPFLPSLLPRSAQAATGARPKFFINFSTANGGAWNENMFPADSMLTESMTYAGRTIQRGALTPTVSGGKSSLSPVLSAPTAKMTPRILGKMNVIKGFDMPYSLVHHSGGFLGNYARNDSTTYGKGKEIPTLDQLMAYSPSFYPDLSGTLLRSMHVGTPDTAKAVSFYWANPAAKSGGIVPIAGTGDSLSLFKKVFVPTQASPVVQRTPVIDRVFENYRRLRQSNRRLSTADGQRLDEHLARLQEIQRRSKVIISCQGVQQPTTNAAKYWIYPGPKGAVDSIPAFQLLNDVLVAAFLCGTSRIATFDSQGALAGFTDYQGGYRGTTDFHGLIHLSSQTDDPAVALESQAQIYPVWQRYFEHVFLDLITKLDVDDGSGQSLLDSSLVVWEQECASITHTAACMPIVAAGAAGGTLKTGSFIDYRNRMVTRMFGGGAKQPFSPGLIWNQWMGVKLQAMGIPRSEYEIPSLQPGRPAGAGTGGYGWFDDASATANVQKLGDYNSAFPVLGEIPPYLRNA